VTAVTTVETTIEAAIAATVTATVIAKFEATVVSAHLRPHCDYVYNCGCS
jgi:hypothetical protein